MAQMKGPRLTQLSPKNILLRVNEDQVQNIVDGLIDGRINVRADSLPLYDSLAMDLIEQLETYGITFPDLVLGEDDDESKRQEYEQVRKILTALTQCVTSMILVDSVKPRQKIGKTATEYLADLQRLLFGEEENVKPDVLQ